MEYCPILAQLYNYSDLQPVMARNMKGNQLQVVVRISVMGVEGQQLFDPHGSEPETQFQMAPLSPVSILTAKLSASDRAPKVSRRKTCLSA